LDDRGWISPKERVEQGAGNKVLPVLNYGRKVA
jgi:hypothetical protein